ncbi:hypothetical protein [Schumannella luteola]
MRLIATRLLALLGVVLVVAAVGPADQPAAVVAALSLASIAAIAIAASVVLAVAPRAASGGVRARQHRQVLIGMPAPQHPATPGRTRSRAPGEVAPAA